MLIYNARQCMHHIANYCCLWPGLNDVPSESWEQALKIKEIRNRVAANEIEVIGESIAAFGERQAYLLVQHTVNPALLETWLKSDGRAAVIEAVRERIKVLAERPKKDEKQERLHVNAEPVA